MLIRELYLIKTTDKTPFVFEPDSSVFTSIDLTDGNSQIIDELTLNSAVFRFCAPCTRMEFNFGFAQGREVYQPFVDSLSHYNYTLSVVGTYDPDNITDYWETFGKLTSDTYQLIMIDSNGTAWICYAEMSIEQYDNNYGNHLIFTMNADNVKEGLYEIQTLSYDSLTTDFDFCIGSIT